MGVAVSVFTAVANIFKVVAPVLRFVGAAASLLTTSLGRTVFGSFMKGFIGSVSQTITNDAAMKEITNAANPGLAFFSRVLNEAKAKVTADENVRRIAEQTQKNEGQVREQVNMCLDFSIDEEAAQRAFENLPSPDELRQAEEEAAGMTDEQFGEQLGEEMQRNEGQQEGVTQ